MKKTSLLYSLLFVAAVGFMASCGKDDEPAAPPSISFLNSTGNATVAVGDSVKVDFVVNKGDANLKEIEVRSNNNTVHKESMSGGNFQGSVYLHALSSGSNEYLFIAKDRDDVEGKITFTVNGETPLIEYDSKTLGAQNGAAGSYFDVTTGTVYLAADAAANASKIDITFAQIGSPTTKPELISPDYRGSRGLTAFAGGSTTYFASSNLDYENATSTEIAAISIPAIDANKYITVEAGKVYAFITAAGEKGLIKVESIDPGLNGSATLSFVVRLN